MRLDRKNDVREILGGPELTNRSVIGVFVADRTRGYGGGRKYRTDLGDRACRAVEVDVVFVVGSADGMAGKHGHTRFCGKPRRFKAWDFPVLRGRKGHGRGLP